MAGARCVFSQPPCAPGTTFITVLQAGKLRLGGRARLDSKTWSLPVLAPTGSLGPPLAALHGVSSTGCLCPVVPGLWPLLVSRCRNYAQVDVCGEESGLWSGSSQEPRRRNSERGFLLELSCVPCCGHFPLALSVGKPSTLFTRLNTSHPGLRQTPSIGVCGSLQVESPMSLSRQMDERGLAVPWSVVLGLGSKH